MHRTALIFTACLFVAGGAGAAGLPPGASQPLESAGAVPAWLLLTQEPEAAEPKGSEAGSSPAENAGGSDDAKEGLPVVQEIIAGILTGSLAAILMLKIIYRRRRRDDSS